MSEEFDQRARELDVLAESSRLLTSSLDAGEVLDRLAEIAQARIGADIARIWLLDDAGESLELRAQTGVIRGTAGLKQPLSPLDSVAGWVIAHKEPICLADVLADARLVNRVWFAAEGVVSLLSVPIMLDHRPIGILACLSRTRREFTSGDVALARYSRARSEPYDTYYSEGLYSAGIRTYSYPRYFPQYIWGPWFGWGFGFHSHGCR